MALISSACRLAGWLAGKTIWLSSAFSASPREATLKRDLTGPTGSKIDFGKALPAIVTGQGFVCEACQPQGILFNSIVGQLVINPGVRSR